MGVASVLLLAFPALGSQGAKFQRGDFLEVLDGGCEYRDSSDCKGDVVRVIAAGSRRIKTTHVYRDTGSCMPREWYRGLSISSWDQRSPILQKIVNPVRIERMKRIYKSLKTCPGPFTHDERPDLVDSNEEARPPKRDDPDFINDIEYNWGAIFVVDSDAVYD